jgi:glutaminase
MSVSGPAPFVSTGTLPSPDTVRALVAEAHERFKSNIDGQNSQVYPALARVPTSLFGISVVAVNGNVYSVGDSDREFPVMSVSKPFVFALVCQYLSAEIVREKIGVNATGRAFNSLESVERGDDGRTNPMVNAGAIACTSLAPGATITEKWTFIHAGLSRFAGRDLSLNDEVYETSGDWLFTVGLPGKSGIGGGIVTVSPGKGGLGTFAPLLDAAGNSIKGQLAAQFLSRNLGLDLFVSNPVT